MICRSASDAQIIVSRFPCGDTTLLHNPRHQPRPFFKNCGEAATTTLGAKGPVKPKNLPAVRPVHLKNPHTEGVSKTL